MVVVPLEPRLADDRGLGQAVEPALLQLGRGDRPDRPEQLGGDVVQWVRAQPDRLDLNPGELELALLKVEQGVLGDVLLDRHVRVGNLREPLSHEAADLRQPQHPVTGDRTSLADGGDPQHPGQAAV